MDAHQYAKDEEIDPRTANFLIRFGLRVYHLKLSNGRIVRRAHHGTSLSLVCLISLPTSSLFESLNLGRCDGSCSSTWQIVRVLDRLRRLVLRLQLRLLHIALLSLPEVNRSLPMSLRIVLPDHVDRALSL